VEKIFFLDPSPALGAFVDTFPSSAAKTPPTRRTPGPPSHPPPEPEPEPEPEQTVEEDYWPNIERYLDTNEPMHRLLGGT
jgi:hypothetical protein